MAPRRRSPDQLSAAEHAKIWKFVLSYLRQSEPRAVPTRDVVLIPAGALDDDPKLRTNYHIYVGSKAPWHEITDDLPQYPEGSPPA